MSKQVLIIDDDAAIRSSVRSVVESEGHSALEARSGPEGLRVLFDQRPDLVVLDLSMPQMDGWTVLDRIRELASVPVIILTGHATDDAAARGLRGGAHDFVAKPFSRRELAARIYARLREDGSEPKVTPFTFSDAVITFDTAQRMVHVLGQEVALTRLEFRLLGTLIANRDRVMSRDSLLEVVWRDPNGYSQTAVKTYVGYLRRKLDRVQSGLGEQLIRTARGFGYQYITPEEAATFER